MKYLTILLLTLFLPSVSYGETEENLCLSYVGIGENYKTAHKYQPCLDSAALGQGPAQYALGMSYGYAGNSELEEKYYRLAASNRNIAAYLSLGHVLSVSNPWEAIYWYQRYVATKSNGYGYAAVLISNLFSKLGDSIQAAYWLEVCEASQYGGCTNAYNK